MRYMARYMMDNGDFITLDEVRSNFLEFGEVGETFEDFMRSALDKNGSLNYVYRFTFTGYVGTKGFTFQTSTAFEGDAIGAFLDFVYDEYGVSEPNFYRFKKELEIS